MEIPSAYLERIRSIYPDLIIQTLDYNQDGLVNEVVVVNGELVCRFVKEKWGQALLKAEAEILDLLVRYVQIPIPRFEHLEKDFCSYRFIPGQPTTRNWLLRMGKQERLRILHQLGIFLTQIHAIPADGLGNIPFSDAVRNHDDWLRLYAQIQEYLFPHLYRYQRDWVKEHFAPFLQGDLDMEYSPVLIHADMAVYHILHNPQTKALSGIIDFGTAGLGDPATDLAVFLVQYGESLAAQMNYSRFEQLLPRARFWAGTMELQWALAGIKNSDKGLAVAHIGGARDIGV